jgi:hypothetical protein
MFRTVCEYNNERSGKSAKLPSPAVCQLLKLRWTGETYEYVNSDEEVLVFCPQENERMGADSSTLLVKREPFLSAVEQAGLVAIWAALSERDCFSYKVMNSKPVVKKRGITQRLYSHEKGKLVCHNDLQYQIRLRD